MIDGGLRQRNTCRELCGAARRASRVVLGPSVCKGLREIWRRRPSHRFGGSRSPFQRRWGLNSGDAPREQAHAAGWDVRATSTQCTAQRRRFLYSYRESEAGRCDHWRQSIGPIGQTLQLHHSRLFVFLSVSIPYGILRKKEPVNQCKRAKSIDGCKTRLA